GWQSFLTAPVAYLPVAVEIGGRTHQARADRGGYLDVLVPDHGLPAGRHEISVHARGAKPVTAQVLVIGPETRVGIVSDIDDTVMVTRVPRPLVAAWNTFVRHTTARQPVPGMAELFRRLGSALPGAPVFYLSTGAWNVVPALERFFRRSGLPTGPMLMTAWGPTNTGWFRSGQEHKRTTLRRLLIDFPHVRWLLIGDDGQHDPEIYAELAREHPDRVVAIGIRRLTAGEHVLAHGTPQASDMGKGHDGGRVSGGRQVPAVAGPAGESLWRERRPYRCRASPGSPVAMAGRAGCAASPWGPRRSRRWSGRLRPASDSGVWLVTSSRDVHPDAGEATSAPQSPEHGERPEQRDAPTEGEEERRRQGTRRREHHRSEHDSRKHPGHAGDVGDPPTVPGSAEP